MSIGRSWDAVGGMGEPGRPWVALGGPAKPLGELPGKLREALGSAGARDKP